MGRHFWCEFFVAEPIIEVVIILRENGVVIDYNENVYPPGLAMGYIENNGGVILSCDVWRKEQSKELMAKTQGTIRTSIELQGSNKDFLKLYSIIKRALTIVGLAE